MKPNNLAIYSKKKQVMKKSKPQIQDNSNLEFGLMVQLHPTNPSCKVRIAQVL